MDALDVLFNGALLILKTAAPGPGRSPGSVIWSLTKENWSTGQVEIITHASRVSRKLEIQHSLHNCKRLSPQTSGLSGYFEYLVV